MNFLNRLFREKNNVLSKYKIDRYNVSLIIAWISEILFYFQYVTQLDIYANSSFRVFIYIIFAIAIIAIKIKSSLAFGLNLFLLCLPFVFFPLVTFIFMLFVFIVFKCAEMITESEQNFLNAIICLTVVCLNNFDASIHYLFIPISLYFLVFGMRKGLTSIYFVFIAFIVIILSVYPIKEMNLSSRINNAPLYTLKTKGESLEGFESLKTYYGEEQYAEKYSNDPILVDTKTKEVAFTNVIGLGVCLIIAVLLSQLLEGMYEKKIKESMILLSISIFTTSIVMFILYYFKSFLGMNIQSSDFVITGLLSFIVSFVLILFVSQLEMDEPIIVSEDYTSEIQGDSIVDRNDDLIAETEVIKEEITERVKSELKQVFLENAQKEINIVHKKDEYEELSSICMGLLSTLTSLTQEAVKAVALEMYSENWFEEVKKILNENPDIFNNPTSILDYKCMDITCTTRLLTDCKFAIGQYIKKTKRDIKLNKRLDAVREARNDFSHNNSEGQLSKGHAYILLNAIDKFRVELYDEFNRFFTAKLSEDYYKKINDYSKRIDHIEKDN